MTNIVLRKSSPKVVAGCSHFVDKEDSSIVFRLSVIDFKPTGETYVAKDGSTKNQLEEFIRPFFVKKSSLSSDLQKLDDEKICQELKGKSIVITTSLED